MYSPQWRSHLMGREQAMPQPTSQAVRVTAMKFKPDLPQATVERKRSQKTSTESAKRDMVFRSLRQPWTLRLRLTQAGPELDISRRRTPTKVNIRRRRQLPESTPKLTLAPVSHSPTRQLLHDQSTSSRGAAPPESPALAGPSGMALSAGLQEFDCHAPGLQCPGAQRRRLRPRQTGHLKRCCRFQRKRGQKRVKEVEVVEEENWLASDGTYCSREPCVVQ